MDKHCAANRRTCARVVVGPPSLDGRARCWAARPKHTKRTTPWRFSAEGPWPPGAPARTAGTCCLSSAQRREPPGQWLWRTAVADGGGAKLAHSLPRQVGSHARTPACRWLSTNHDPITNDVACSSPPPVCVDPHVNYEHNTTSRHAEPTTHYSHATTTPPWLARVSGSGLARSGRRVALTVYGRRLASR